MIMEIKKRIIYSLVVFTIILLLLNALLDSQNTNYNREAEVGGTSLSRIKIEQSFEKTLSNYGIKNNWIKKKPKRAKQYDSLKYKYEIEVPSSVPIPMIIKELSLKLKNENISLTSKEEKINGLTKLRIKSNNKLKLLADLKYNTSLQRSFSSIAFILTDVESLGNDELKILLAIPIKFGVLLPLRTSSINIAEKILAAKRNYFINLDDDGDKVSFELDEDLGINELKRNIKSIVSSFNTPRKYFISKKRTGFSNSFINFLSDEFRKRNREILKLDLFLKLKGEDARDLNSLLNFHLNKLPTGKSKLFFISVNDWENIQPVLNSYIKKGNKIVLPTKLFQHPF